jgi:hypothetical protein
VAKELRTAEQLSDMIVGAMGIGDLSFLAQIIV